MIYQFEVISSTLTEKGRFCNKLITETSRETPFGVVRGRRTYYLFTDTENKVGKKLPLDLKYFDKVSRHFTFTEEGEDVETILWYLHPKM